MLCGEVHYIYHDKYHPECFQPTKKGGNLIGYPEYLKSEIYASQTKQAFTCSLAR